MYYIEQLPMQEIADELGLHISSVSRTIKSGRERLKSSLSYGGRNLDGIVRRMLTLHIGCAVIE